MKEKNLSFIYVLFIFLFIEIFFFLNFNGDLKWKSFNIFLIY